MLGESQLRLLGDTLQEYLGRTLRWIGFQGLGGLGITVGFREKRLGFRVQGLGFIGLKFRVEGLGFRVYGLRFSVRGPKLCKTSGRFQGAQR